MDDIFNKLPYTDESLHILEWKTFIDFLKKNNWDMDKIKTGNLIKRLEEYL